MSRIPMCLVGCGGMGTRHVAGFAALKRTGIGNVDLVAVCDIREDNARRAADEAERSIGRRPAIHTSIESALADPAIAAFDIVTEAFTHIALALPLLAAGRHVFCEKPLSMVLDECLAVEAEARKHPKLKTMIGYVRRFDASYQDAQKKIAAGAIGRPFLVRSQTTDKHDPSGFFVRFAPKSGGIFIDMSVHDVDCVRWLLGSPKPTRVFSVGAIEVHEGLAACGDVDNALAAIEFEGGAMATIYASRTMAHGHESATEVVGTKGRLVIGRDGLLNRVEVADEHGIRVETTPTFWERFEDAFLRETIHFVDCVRHDRPPGLTLHDATEATRIAIAMRTSLVERRAVDL